MLAKQRIYDHLVTEIRSGQVKVGERLPTEKEIAADFSVSRSTVQAVMARLATEGYIRRYAGRGTFACRSEDMRVRVNLDIHNIQSFENEVAVAGERVTYRLISFARVPAPLRAAEKLGIKADDPVLSLKRLRFIEGDCIGMETRYFSPRLRLDFPMSALETKGVHTLIEDGLGIAIGRIDAVLRAVNAAEADATHLGVNPGAPLLVRSHTLYDLDDQVILHGESSYVEPFAFRYSANIRR